LEQKSMAVYLIDPVDKSVIDVELVLNGAMEGGEDFLETVRGMIKDQRRIEQLAIIGLSSGQAAMIVDNFGMLRKRQAFWRLTNGTNKIGGKAMLFAVAPDGTLMPFPPNSLSLESLRNLVVFEDVTVTRIVEQVVTTPGQVPQIARLAIYSDDPEPEIEKQIMAAREAESHPIPDPSDLPPDPSDQSPNLSPNQSPHLPPKTTSQPPASQAPTGEAVLDSGWIVRALSSGGVQAVRYVLEADSIKPAAERLTAANLAELRKLMPEGYERREPDDDAPADVIEMWVLPIEPMMGTSLH
jgi:hypothetical protein